MALITDPDNLNDSAADDNSTEVYIDTTAKTIKLVKTGNLSDDGVTLKALYSFLKEEWRNDTHTKNLAAFPFPMTPITDESFELIDGWDFDVDATRYLIRTGGWTVRNTAGAVISKWAGIIGLGTIESNDQLYYQQESGGVSANVVLQGQINQAVCILDDPNGDGNYVDGFDNRTFFKLFGREYQQLYDDASLADIGVTAMDSIAYRFPISTGSDSIKITHDDTAVSTTTPYTQINIKYFSSAYSRAVDTPGTPRNFGIVIDVGTHSSNDGSCSLGGSTFTSANGGITGANYTGGTLTIHEGDNAGAYTISGTPSATEVTITGTFPAADTGMSFTLQRATPVTASAEQIYEKVQWSLRQDVDINDGPGTAVIGKTADMLLTFVGDTLKAGTLSPVNPNGGGNGVIIEGFSATDTNRLVFRDSAVLDRTFPYVAALTINFGDNLRLDASAKYWVYFTTLPGAGNDFGESSAIIVKDNANADMTGDVSGATSVVKSFNYDGNNQGGRTIGTDAGITVVGIGLGTGQYVRATGTIQKSTSNSVSLVAALERNYLNAT